MIKIRMSINKHISNYKLTIFEILLKKTLWKKVKSEIFDMKWTYNFYKLHWERKYKNKLNKMLEVKKMVVREPKSKINKIMRINKHDQEDDQVIKYGKLKIQSVFLEKEIERNLINPILEEEALWEGPTIIDKAPTLVSGAYKFFRDWNEFLIDTKDECDLEVRKTMFPLNETEDFFFYREILNLEKKYGNKITTFIAIFYINRMFNEREIGIQEIENRICDLQNLFRHKDSLGWFIALLKIIKIKTKNNNVKEFNIDDMIGNLCYVYDILPECKTKSNKTGFPIIVATLLPLAISTIGSKSISLYTQSKLLMLEVIPQLAANNIGLEQSQLLNAARLGHYRAFEELLLDRNSPLFSLNKDFHKNMAYAYSFIYKEIRPNNNNTTIISSLLLEDSGSVGKFSKEVASAGISCHFDNYQLVRLPYNATTDPFEYGIIVDNTVKAVEVKQYGSYYNSFDKVVREYERQKAKGVPNFVLLIDYCSRNGTLYNGDFLRIQNIETLIAKNGLQSQIIFVNSADDSIPINRALRQYTQAVVDSRIEEYTKFLSILSEKDVNKLSGKTKCEPEDPLRYSSDLTSFLGSPKQTTYYLK